MQSQLNLLIKYIKISKFLQGFGVCLVIIAVILDRMFNVLYNTIGGEFSSEKRLVELYGIYSAWIPLISGLILVIVTGLLLKKHSKMIKSISGKAA